jgi:hypothetical protein
LPIAIVAQVFQKTNNRCTLRPIEDIVIPLIHETTVMRNRKFVEERLGQIGFSFVVNDVNHDYRQIETESFRVEER